MRIFLQRFLVGKFLPGSSPRCLFIVLFGVFIGFLLGILLKFEKSTDLDRSSHFLDTQTNLEQININKKQIWIKCAILIQDNAETPEKYLSAITDTYGSKCNETLFLTSSLKLFKKYSDSLKIVHVNTGLHPSSWSSYRHFLSLIDQNNSVDSTYEKWIVIITEKNYLVVENLMAFLQKHSQIHKSIMIGKLEHINPFLSFAFPFTQKKTFVMDAGIVLSDTAFKIITNNTSSDCKANNWFKPSYTGKGLLKCAKTTGITIWDPIDEDGDHLLIPTNLRTHFSSYSIKKEANNLSSKPEQKLTGCCSHKAIIFGYLSYREIRLIHYATSYLRVFGI